MAILMQDNVEKHCDQAVKKLGFVPIGPNWPSMYYYSRLKLLLVVYVDDLKLAGPEGNLAEGWKMLRSLLNIEPETDLGMYLGCTLRKGEGRLKDGTRVSTMTYDMESFLEQCIERYKEVAGKDVVLKNVATPSLPEDTKQHPARAPCSSGDINKCPCVHAHSRAEATFHKVSMPKELRKLQIRIPRSEES